MDAMRVITMDAMGGHDVYIIGVVMTCGHDGVAMMDASVGIQATRIHYTSSQSSCHFNSIAIHIADASSVSISGHIDGTS